MLTEEQRIKKAHIALMKHPETALYSGVMMMGTTEVIAPARPMRPIFSIWARNMRICMSLAISSTGSQSGRAVAYLT